MDFERLVALCQNTHEQFVAAAGRSVDTHLVARNFLIGLYIVQYEQEGADRARYGRQTLKALSASLRAAVGRGFSVDNLELMRKFFVAFRDAVTGAEISETASRKSPPKPQRTSESLPPGLDRPASAIPGLAATPLGHDLIRRWLGCFHLGWSHYVELLTIDAADERRFYELEAVANAWSVRELQRQIASSLYQRLALSRDKDEIRRLAAEGQVVEKAADLIKNPLVLEFLGLHERPQYSEDELESSIICRRFCSRWARAFCSRLGKSGSRSTTTTFEWTWSFTIACSAATCCST